MSYDEPTEPESPAQDPPNELAKAELAQHPDMDFDMTRPKTLRQAFTIAQYLAQSGMFKDVRSVREAFGKIAIAIDLGLSPTQGLRSIHLIEGKPELGFDVIGSLMKDRGYSWTVEFDGNESVTLDFTDKDGRRLGLSEFSMQDADDAGLSNKTNWKKYPRNMLFARALSNGARWYAPEVFGGAVCAQGELKDTDDPPPELPTDQTEEQASGEAPAPSDGAGQPATATGTESPAEPAATIKPRPDGPPYCKYCNESCAEGWDCDCPGAVDERRNKDDGPGEPKNGGTGSKPTPSTSSPTTEPELYPEPVPSKAGGGEAMTPLKPEPANWLEAIVSRETYVELRGMAADEELDAAEFINDPLAETDDPDIARHRFERWLQTSKRKRKNEDREAEKIKAAQDARGGA